MKKLPRKYRKINRNEIENELYPNIEEDYCDRINTDYIHKKPKRVLITEIYEAPYKKECYNYYNNTSCHMNRKRIHHSKDDKRMDYDDNEEMIIGGTDIREEFSAPKDNRVNIRKKVYRGSNSPQSFDRNCKEEGFLENFQYHETRNINENNNNKYKSITRITGYSNLIPLYKRQQLIHNVSNVDVKRNENNKYNYENEKEINIITTQKQIKKYDKNIEKIDKKEKFDKKNIENKVEKKINIEKYMKNNKSQKSIVEKKEVKDVKSNANNTLNFRVHHGRYKYKSNISDDIANSRKQYKENKDIENVKKLEIVHKNTKANKINTNKNVETNKKNEINEISKKYSMTHKIKETKEVKKPIVKNLSHEKLIVKNYNNQIKMNIPKKVKPKNKSSKNTFIKKSLREENTKINNYEIAPVIIQRPLGDNYKYYERKILVCPDENSFTVHQRRNERLIYGNFYNDDYMIYKKNRPRPRMTDYNQRRRIIERNVMENCRNKNYTVCDRCYGSGYQVIQGKINDDYYNTKVYNDYHQNDDYY